MESPHSQSPSAPPASRDALAGRLEEERPRLLALATRILGDPDEAQDIVQQAWLRLDSTAQEVENLPAWLTTVTTRLCLDRLRRRVPEPEPEEESVADAAEPDPAEQLALAETVGVALQAVLDRLTPNERVAFVMHDSFGFEFATIAAALGTSVQNARKLASRARAKVSQPRPEDPLADWEVVDAFMAASRGGDLTRLLALLTPDAVVRADAAAIAAGTPEALDGRTDIAAFFDGAAHAALAVSVDGRPGAAWFHRGQARVLFDVTVAGGRVASIVFRADPAVLDRVVRRDGPSPR
ncbi:sigma-70 family RNA polymerase sigma factor [Brachybacterium saurashtrense]|uniref:RNA polymerase subunit sigma-70 n=1 Tax=Brachybacterium saurashtrense TaxID=556288 RepID=A0A345YSD5_9MICO|nr:sigma-70 family RNA polymerase sigma factor [Brachybacterium saurashtrense]AXK46837.1 RNA polymerase subunit sigma-70 [Brachybacterium saurashtrense]RRR22552.1 RNA polymerase subunit sigma-70 [Brachybacterium saurashtrense]